MKLREESDGYKYLRVVDHIGELHARLVLVEEVGEGAAEDALNGLHLFGGRAGVGVGVGVRVRVSVRVRVRVRVRARLETRARLRVRPYRRRT